MNELFKEELYKFVTIFLDDVLIYSSDEKEHANHLRLVLKKLEEAGLKLKRPNVEWAALKYRTWGITLEPTGYGQMRGKSKP